MPRVKVSSQTAGKIAVQITEIPNESQVVGPVPPAACLYPKNEIIELKFCGIEKK